MKVIQSLKSSLTENTVTTIGTFDGVHVGHKKIIERLVKTAKDDQLKSTVLTFFPHPRMVLQKDANIKLINTIDERCKLLEAQGLDYVVIKPFTKSFSRLSAEEFVTTILVDQLHVKKIIIGYDHHFGKGRNGNIELLKAMGTSLNFKVEEINEQLVHNEIISSTLIRNYISDQQIKKANDLLGYAYFFEGFVVRGNHDNPAYFTGEFDTDNLKLLPDYTVVNVNGINFSIFCNFCFS